MMTEEQFLKITLLLNLRKEELKKDWLYYSARLLLEEVQRLNAKVLELSGAEDDGRGRG